MSRHTHLQKNYHFYVLDYIILRCAQINRNLDHNHQPLSALDAARYEAWGKGGCGTVFCMAKVAGLDQQTWEAEAMNGKPQ